MRQELLLDSLEFFKLLAFRVFGFYPTSFVYREWLKRCVSVAQSTLETLETPLRLLSKGRQRMLVKMGADCVEHPPLSPLLKGGSFGPPRGGCVIPKEAFFHLTQRRPAIPPRLTQRRPAFPAPFRRGERGGSQRLRPRFP